MGKRVKNREFISAVRKKHNIRRRIIIASEGKLNSERLYFEHFRKRNMNYSIQFASGNDTDPVSLVTILAKDIKNNGLDINHGDMAFCVMDVDTDAYKDTSIQEAQEIAKKNGIQIITSAPCFELWLLLHYETTTAYLSNKEVTKRLKKYCLQYQKTYDIFPDIEKNIDIAIKRAKELEQYQLQNGKKIGTVAANPSTEIYKIIEYLNNLEEQNE